jgi:hypothetical protein
MSKIIRLYNSFQKWIILFAMIFINAVAYAGCDMCSLYLGLHPNQVKNGISLRYRYSVYDSKTAHVHNGVAHSTNPQIRTFQTVEVWGQMNFGRKMQAVIMLPYAMNSIEEKGLVVDAYNYIGDVQGLLRYQLYRSDPEKTIVSRVILGIGLKAPTGRYTINSNDGHLDQHIQTGSGSWDVLYNAGYLLKYKQLSLNEELLYKMNTENNLNYKFADRFSSNTTLFYTFSQKEISILPSIGYLLEFANEDKLNNISLGNTNGTSHYFVGGIDLYYKYLNCNITYQKAFIENLRDTETSNRYRFIIGLGINF